MAVLDRAAESAGVMKAGAVVTECVTSDWRLDGRRMEGERDEKVTESVPLRPL